MTSLFFHGLYGLDDAAGAQAGSAQVDEVLRVLQIGNAAGSLDLHIGAHVLGEQGHVLTGGAAPAEAGGGLDVVRAGGSNDLAQLDLLLVGEEAALDDDEKMEIWEVNLAEPQASSTDKFKAKYFQGYLTEIDKTSNAEDNVELSLTFGLEGKGVDGYATVTAEQQEVAAYVFADTQKTGA